MTKFISEHPYILIEYLLFVTVSLIIGLMTDKGRLMKDGINLIIRTCDGNIFLTSVLILTVIMAQSISYLIVFGHLGILHAFTVSHKIHSEEESSRSLS